MSYDEEYFCPHCGAILNDQPGFDPDNGTWICTECGELLMDEDVYDGDNYEGVAWFCDNCGALLNRQDGFSDSYEKWTCTECGHVNGVTDEDIIDGFRCPSCGAILDTQSGFDKYDDDWDCEECGAHLHHSYSDDEYEEAEEGPEEPEEPEYSCPSCGADLENQYGFSEYRHNWDCTDCGAHLYHSYSGEDYIVIKHLCPKCNAPLDIQWSYSDYKYDMKCTECGTELHRDYSSDEFSISDDDDDEDEDDDDCDEGIGDDSEKPAYSYSYKQNSGFNANTDSYRTYQHSHKERKSASSYLNAKKVKGNIWTKVISLASILSIITCVMYLTNFDEWLSHPDGVRIRDSASAYKNVDYYNAVMELKRQGLTDIRLTRLDDLKGGIFSGDGGKEGKISTIEINGKSDFQSGTWVAKTSVVNITYHSFKKTEKKGYDTNKNNHLFIYGIDIQLPPYLINEKQEGKKAIYHVKGEDDTKFVVSIDRKSECSELSLYNTYFILQRGNREISGMSGQETIALGKRNNKIYLIREVALSQENNMDYLHLTMKTPDLSKTDYVSDYEAMLSDVYIPKDSEIRIDFTSKNYEGRNFKDVAVDLEAKGFKNIKVKNLQDVVLGLFTKEGTVENVFINGNVGYQIGGWVDYLSEIVITYHGKK